MVLSLPLLLQELGFRPRIGPALGLATDLLHEVDGDRRGFVIPFAADIRQHAGDLLVGEETGGGHVVAISHALDLDGAA